MSDAGDPHAANDSRRAGGDILAPLREKPHAFQLFAALRLLEQAYSSQPRLGESRKASDDLVRLGQAPHLSFAPSDIASVEGADGGEGDARLTLEQFGFGLFGPNGALPLHLTELAYERRRQREDATVVDFLNLFQHRLISLFYRAWADTEPAVSLDRPSSDRFRGYVGALMGLEPETARDADWVPDYAKLSRAGLFAPQARSAEGLEDVLADYFAIDVQVRQFVGAWLDVPDTLSCRLGDPTLATLGTNTTLGSSTWQCQHKFEIVLGPLDSERFADFLPGSRGLAELHSVVRLYTNDEWEWQARLLLRNVDIPGICLGQGARMGWTSWLGKREAAAQDVVIQASRVAERIPSF
ncbi:MAG TPA: type VI secretion system baseplate subunit TssG [Steroidobacteraceae bacterium]|jgi:type VI secretion system protein ImpH